MAYGLNVLSSFSTQARFIVAILNPVILRANSICIRTMSSKTMADETGGELANSAPGLMKVLEGNPKRLKRINFLGELFKTNGHELRIAGGAVRDILRGKEPYDIDFATTAKPEQSEEILRKHEDLLRIIVTPSGLKHGTVAVKFKTAEIDFKRIKLDSEVKKNVDAPDYDEESPYEITTLRRDKFTDGRHAEVEFHSDWEEDAERRDLTINAMFLTLDDGRLIDYFGGENDLKEGCVRFVGDADLRIKEDYLRILRFFRFWSRYGQNKAPDDETLSKLQNNLEGLNGISGERIWQEIKKTLSHLPCKSVVDLMLKLRVFDYAGLRDKDSNDYDNYCKTVLEELSSVEENVSSYLNDILIPNLRQNPEDSDAKKLKDLFPVVLFASIVRTDELCKSAHKRMKFSNQERDTIHYFIKNRDNKANIKGFKYQLFTSSKDKGERRQVMQRICAFCIARGQSDIIGELKSWEVPVFPIDGSIVKQAFKDRKLPANKIKDVIDDLKLDWSKSDYKLSQKELMSLLPDKVQAVADGKFVKRLDE